MHDADAAGVVHAEPPGGEDEDEALVTARFKRLTMAGDKLRGADFRGHVVCVTGDMGHGGRAFSRD